MKNKQPPTKSQLIAKKKEKFYNQMRNLLVKQFKEMAKFHEEWDKEHPNTKDKHAARRSDQVHSTE